MAEIKSFNRDGKSCEGKMFNELSWKMFNEPVLKRSFRKIFIVMEKKSPQNVNIKVMRLQGHSCFPVALQQQVVAKDTQARKDQASLC